MRNFRGGVTSTPVEMRATTLLLVLTLALLAPASALARWSRPAAVPAFEDQITGGVDDRGHATVAFRTDRGVTRLARLALDGRRREVPLRGVDSVAALRVTPDGTAVGVGTHNTSPPEPPGTEHDGHDKPCCWAPTVVRWPAGDGPPTAHPVDGLPNDAYTIDPLAVAPDGAATFLTYGPGDPVADIPAPFSIVSVARDDASVFVRKLADSTRHPTAVRSLAGGRTAVAWRDGADIRMVTLRDDAPSRPGRFQTFVARHTNDEKIAIDGRGRLVRAFGVRHHLYVSVDGRPPTLVGPHGTWQDQWALGVGAGGTIVVAYPADHRILVRTIDPRGRWHTPIDAGGARPKASVAVALDARDRPHVAWETPGGHVAVRGPRGTHRLGAGSSSITYILDLVVSPAGAELVLRGDGATAWASFSSP